MEWYLFLGYAAAFASVVTSYVRTMIPLRIISMVCNSLFITYGIFGGIYPTLVLNLILLPMNGWRLYEMVRLTQKVKAAAVGNHSFDWLKSFMRRHNYRAGEILFRKGEEGDAL